MILRQSIPHLLLALCALTWAWAPARAQSTSGEITVGRELEFTSASLKRQFQARMNSDISFNEATIPAEAEARAAQRFAEAIHERCRPNCQMITHPGKWPGGQEYRFKFEQGPGFNVSYDPMVVEIQVDPLTPREHERTLERWRTLLFEVAEDLNFDGYLRSAHLNIGFRSAFPDDDAKAFLRHFVDVANHPELALGALGNDVRNAPPLSHLPRKQQDALEGIVKAVNEGRITSAIEVVKRIKRDVYTTTPHYTEDPIHYQAYSIKRVPLDPTDRYDQPFELRFIRQPETPQEMQLMAELMQRRIDYLKTIKGPIVYRRPAMRPNYSERELASRFYLYVRESGLDYDKYKPLLERNLRATPIDGFLRGTIEWKNANWALEARRYAQDFAVSPMIENRLYRAFAHPDAAKSPIARKILERVFADGQRAPVQAHRLLQRIQQLPAWRADVWLTARAQDMKASALEALGRSQPSKPSSQCSSTKEAVRRLVRAILNP